VTRLEDQVRKSVELTMRGPQLDDRKIEDLTAFLRTLPQPPSLMTARYGDRLATQAPELAASIERGRAIFNEKLCSTCHTPGVYTSSATYDVDLPDERGQREFNPPSLRGVSQRNRLFHDNRSNGLTEVFAKYRHGLDGQLTVRQIEDLVAFLRSL
jgi:cytochrome c peroxidase